MAQFFEDELQACAELDGPAKAWPARYGFSLLWFWTGLCDNPDLVLWAEWLA